MKTKFLVALFITFISFHSFSQFSDKYFSVTSSTSQDWGGGTADSGSGTNYTFSISLSKDAAITFDSVWIAGGTVLFLGTGKNIVDFIKGDVCTLYASQYYPGYDLFYDYDIVEIKTGSPPPILYKGCALIRFKVKGEIYYYAVEEMQKLAAIAYP